VHPGQEFFQARIKGGFSTADHDPVEKILSPNQVGQHGAGFQSFRHAGRERRIMAERAPEVAPFHENNGDHAAFPVEERRGKVTAEKR